MLTRKKCPAGGAPPESRLFRVPEGTEEREKGERGRRGERERKQRRERDDEDGDGGRRVNNKRDRTAGKDLQR